MVKVLTDSWWKSLPYVTWWVFSRLWAPLVAIGAPILVIYGLAYPKQLDMTALNLSKGEIAFLVGETSGGSDCVNYHPCKTIAGQRLYLVFPRMLASTALTVIDDQSGVLSVDQKKGYGLIALLIWAACLYGTWYFWIRPFIHTSAKSKGQLR